MKPLKLHVIFPVCTYVCISTSIFVQRETTSFIRFEGAPGQFTGSQRAEKQCSPPPQGCSLPNLNAVNCRQNDLAYSTNGWHGGTGEAGRTQVRKKANQLSLEWGKFYQLNDLISWEEKFKDMSTK